MYKVYFLDRSFTICSPDYDCSSDLEAVVYHNAPAIGEALDEFLRNERIHSLYIPVPDPEAVWNEFKTLFTEVNAAGGLIRHGDRYLMIFRLGVWDLPKGKQEPGEPLTGTALREVQEECGVPRPELGSLRCITHHTYHRDGHFCLKHTYWYDMTLDSEAALKPQTEEDISQAVWVSAGSVPDKLLNTYPSVREVMKGICLK